MNTGQELRPGDCLVGGGQMGTMMRAADWGRTPLGPVGSWPQSLCTALSMILGSRLAMVVAWGPELRFFYNDRFQAILGARHPNALGAPGAEIFPDIWHLIGPELERVRHGESVSVDDWLLPLARDGERENSWFTISCSPIRDESGGVAGLLSVVWETTVRVESERRLATLYELAACAAEARTEQQVCASIAAAFERNPIDVPFAVLYALEEDGRTARRLAHPGLPADHVAAPAIIDLAAPEVPRGWPLARVARTSAPEVVSDLRRQFGELWGGAEPGTTQSAILLPLSRRGLAHSYGVLVAGISPRRSLDDRYRRFFELASEHIATAIANARALEAPPAAARGNSSGDEAAGWLPDAAVRAGGASAERGERVLIVDDDPTVREYLRDVLEAHWRVTAVGDGAAALAELRRAPPDVIVTDVMMPGVDGYDLLRAIRGDERTRELPVMMLSASADEEARVGGLQAGADDYLVKPFSARELVARVASQLAASASRRAAEQHRRTLYALFEHLPAAIAVLRGEHLVYEMANRCYLQERSLAEIVGRPAFEVAPHLRQGFAELIEHVRRTGEPFAVTELRVVHDPSDVGAAEERWWHVALVPLADERGGRDRIMTFSYDVTELVFARQRAEATAAELQKSVSLIDATLSSVPVGLAFFDRELRFVRVNDTLARWNGWEPQRLIGRALADFAPPGSYEWIAPRVRDAFATEHASEPIERTVPGLAAGEPRHWLLTFYPVRPASAGVELVGLVVVDVTAHKRALLERAEALAREARARWEIDAQQAYLRQLFMQAPVPICILRGPRLAIELANECCCEAWRRAHDEVIGRPLFEALSDSEPLVFRRLLEGVLETGEPYEGKEMPAGHRGETVYFNFVYSPMRGPDGAVDGILVIATDVTDEVRAREEMSRTVQYNEKFIAILGHDLRNPLNAITTTAQLLKRRATSDEIAKPAARIIRSGERMLRMITQLFDLARVRVTGGLRLEPKHVDLAEVCRHVLEELRVAHPDSILELVTIGSLVGRWDGDRLAQVLSNLGANAIEHGTPFTPVYIRLDGADPARVVIRVENQGAIPDAILPFLFDPFRSAHHRSESARGLGLGLYISKEIVVAHRGTIAVHSCAADGTCIAIELPRGEELVS